MTTFQYFKYNDITGKSERVTYSTKLAQKQIRDMRDTINKNIEDLKANADDREHAKKLITLIDKQMKLQKRQLEEYATMHELKLN